MRLQPLTPTELERLEYLAACGPGYSTRATREVDASLHRKGWIDREVKGDDTINSVAPGAIAGGRFVLHDDCGMIRECYRANGAAGL